MSWPLPKNWNIIKPGCGLDAPDKLIISGTNIYLNDETSPPWGENLTRVIGSDTKSTFKADGVHDLEHDEANGKLTCTYPAGSLAPRRKRRRAERQHPHKDPHTGGTMTSWTAEEGS